MRFADFLSLLISRRWFLKRDRSHHDKISSEVEGFGTYDPDDFGARANLKRRGFLVAAVQVAAALAAGVVLAIVLNEFYPVSVLALRVVRLVAVGLVAWAVLSRLGYESDTWKGLTLVELTSLAGFKMTYLFGLFLTAVALFLTPAV